MPPENLTPYTEFAVHVAPHVDGGTEVTIMGELDLATLADTQTALGKALDAEGPVTIDMRACSFVDSRGIAALVAIALRLREQGRDLTIHGVQPRVMRTLDRAGITQMDRLDVRAQERAPGAGS